MEDKRISELPLATTPSGVEILEIVQGGVNKQTTLQDIADLAGDEHFKGVYASEAALNIAVPSAVAGDYAFVDAGPGQDVTVFLWDTDDSAWVAGGSGGVVPDSSETVKGIIEIATQAETNTGTDDVRALTPLKLANSSQLSAKAPLASPTFIGTPAAPTAAAGTNTTQVATTAFVTTADNLKTDSLTNFSRKTASHTLDSTDLTSINNGDDLVIEMNVATANTVTIPENATVAFPIGTRISVTWYGAGQPSFLAASGSVTLRPSAGPGILTIPSRYTPAVIEKVATNEWYVWNGAISPTVPIPQDWSSSLAPTGFSAVATQLAHYTDDGEWVHIWLVISGTSNATTFTFSLPLALHTAYGTNGVVYPVTIINNGTTAVGRIVITGTSNSVAVEATITGTTFTASGTKAIRCYISYER